MATFLIVTIFILGYLLIALEHSVKVNKAATALMTGVLCWTIFILDNSSAHFVNEELLHHLGEIGSILFFLLGAMTIVELIDSHSGFSIITRRINTNSKSRLLLVVSVITFFLSALLDNLTTTIVMTSLCAKILSEKEDRLWFAGMIVIAANAGGAWSPLGDVTTTMLWIGGQITAYSIITQIFLPSVAAAFLPVLIVMYKFKGKKIIAMPKATDSEVAIRDGKIVLVFGIGFLIFVPVFKTITHLPPFMGMLFALGCMWIITTVLHKKKESTFVQRYSVAHALQKIDTPSILFFLGILLAVAALQSNGLLAEAATHLNAFLKNDYLIGTALGLLSALVDNVPLVAAAQGMYDLTTYPTDHPFWEFLALTTGTGGSAIIIGSAAGVAAMGIEAINFMWYLKKISWLALIGFFAAIGVFLLERMFW
jgi:Na+/H+ antiporter NhaD/arsenite permease-like protein